MGAGPEQRITGIAQADLAATGLAAHGVGEKGELIGLQAQRGVHFKLAAAAVEQGGIGDHPGTGLLNQDVAAHFDQAVLGRAGLIGGNDGIAGFRPRADPGVVIDAAAPHRNGALQHLGKLLHCLTVNPVQIVLGCRGAGETQYQAGKHQS